MTKKSRRKRTLENILIEKIGYWWVGIGKMENGKKILVKGWALPGSVVDIRITRNRKDVVQWHIIAIHKQDPEYSDWKIFCPHYFVEVLDQKNLPSKNKLEISKIGCGGCKWQVMKYEKQLELKEKIVLENFQKTISTQWTDFLPIIGSPEEKNYRNKIEFSFGKYLKRFFVDKNWLDKLEVNLDDKPKWREVEAHRNLWFHKQGEFSKVVDIESCWLVSIKVNEIFKYMKNLLKNSWLPVHDQKTHEWFFRHLVFREAVNTDQILVNLVVADKYFEQTNRQNVREIMKENLKKDEFLRDKITTFLITNNNGLADTVRGPEITTETLRWDGFIFEKLILNKSSSENVESSESIFRISPFSFFQTNTLGAQQLFSKSAELIKKVKWTVLDLYCGTGTIGLSFLKMGIGDDLVGVEIVESAIVDAKKNAEINNLSKQSFFVAGPAEKVILENQEIHKKITKLWLVIIDPPREWLHSDVINFLLKLRQEYQFKLLYISCNPVTMSRDVDLFVEWWMKLKTLQAVDMFPQTHHIECIGIIQ